MVLEASESLAGKYGANCNEKSNFGYTEKEWEWIWSSMMEDGAWAVPAITDKNGNYIKDNFAPELLIRFAAHHLKHHIIVLDLQLDRIQFCSGNFLLNNNVIFGIPLLL